MGVLVAAIALGVVALHWSSATDAANQRTASYEREARHLRVQERAARATTDSLKLKATSVITAFDDVNGWVDAVAPSQQNAGRVSADAIALYNQGDFAAARAKFSGDGAAAVADASKKTASADAALAVVQKAIADLKEASGG